MSTTLPLEESLQAHHEAAFQWALFCCRGAREDAEEALQEAYLRALDGRAHFAERARFQTWLFALIRRVVAEQRRQLYRRIYRWYQRREEQPAPLEGSPEQRYLEGERAALLARSLEQLSARQRSLIELVCYHELTIREAAEILSIPLGTARTHYARGKARLATILTREELSYVD